MYDGDQFRPAATFKEAITYCLATAISEVVDDEFKRLSHMQHPLDVAKSIHEALNELGGLQRGRMPDYTHEWVPLLYLTWYHPAQVNLAHSMIMQHGWKPDAQNRSLYVIDYGCGTLAMLFGLVIGKLDSMIKGLPYPAQVSVDLMDDSSSMIDIGMRTWKRFIDLIEKQPALPKLNPLWTRIISKTNDTEFSYRDERWISALHVVYEQNWREVKSNLDSLTRSISPNTVFITTVRQSSYWAYNTSSFLDQSTDIILDFQEEPQRTFQGYIDTITLCRKRICEQLLRQTHFTDRKQVQEVLEDPILSYSKIGSQPSTYSILTNWRASWTRGGTPYARIYRSENTDKASEARPP